MSGPVQHHIGRPPRAARAPTRAHAGRSRRRAIRRSTRSGCCR